MALNIYEYVNNQGEYSLRASREELPTRRNRLVGTLEEITKKAFEEDTRKPNSELTLTINRTYSLRTYEQTHPEDETVLIRAYVSTVLPRRWKKSIKKLVLTAPKEKPPFKGVKDINNYWMSATKNFTGVHAIGKSAKVSITYAGTLTLSRAMLVRILQQANTYYPAKVTYYSPRKHSPQKTIRDEECMGGI